MSRLTALDTPTPRPPEACPEILRKALTKGTGFYVVVAGVLLFGAYQLRERYIWPVEHFLSAAPIAVAWTLVAVAVLYAAYKYSLVPRLWRSGVVVPAEIFKVTKHITHHSRNGVRTGSTEHYQLDIRFKGSSDLTWDVTFDTEETSHVEGSAPPSGPFEVLFRPGGSAPGRVVVIESATRLHDAVPRKAGNGTAGRTFLLVLGWIALLAAAAAGGALVNTRLVRSSYEESESRDETRVKNQEKSDWAGRPHKTPVAAAEPLTQVRGTQNRLLRVHYPESFKLAEIRPTGGTKYVYPRSAIRLTRTSRPSQVLQFVSEEKPTATDLQAFAEEMHRDYLSRLVIHDKTKSFEMSTCAGLPALVHRGTYKDIYYSEPMLHVSCAILHQGHGYFLSYSLFVSSEEKDGPLLRAIVDSTELY